MPLKVPPATALASGKQIAAIIATMGTTDAFGIDDLEAIYALRERLVADFHLDYRPHIHADAVIGWAWSVFNDYGWLANELGFRGRTVRALAAAWHGIRHLRLADTIGIDFHKTGFAPYISSLVLARDRGDFDRIARPRAAMPYLFQSGEYHPAMFTLETTRSGTGPLAALASLRLLGKEGLRVLLGHAVEMAEVLREHIESHPNLTVLNGDNVGPVTLFRAYPDGIDTFHVKDRERSDPGYRDQLRPTTTTTAESTSWCMPKPWPAAAWPSRSPIAIAKPTTANRSSPSRATSSRHLPMKAEWRQ